MEELAERKKQQMLKLVTKSFFNELLKFGVEKNDLVTVSVYLLDHVTDQDDHFSTSEEYYNELFTLHEVRGEREGNALYYQNVSIRPVGNEHLDQLSDWLNEDEVRNTYIGFFPKNKDRLNDYLMSNQSRHYFSICQDNNFVGIIGAENVDRENLKLEMKKFVRSAYSGMGIGKKATFLFLYYVFQLLNFNKVYIYTLDTNLRNINLNAKFGFELTGIHFQDVRIDGNFYDVLKMSLIRSRWEKIFAK
jgi:RimJ/RimL family protein N-acetyltransferase